MRLATGLHRVGSDLVAAYLIEDGGGITVIDTGLPGHWKELLAELATMGRSIEDVRGAVLTHADTDHIGFAERLRRERGVPILVHEADAARARGEDKSNGKAGSMKFGPLLQFLWYSARRGGLRIPPVTEVVTVTHGQELDLPGSPRVIHLPGHTVGSIAIHVPAVDALFVGDALTTRSVLTGQEGPQPAPFTLEPELPSGPSSASSRFRRRGCCPATVRHGVKGSPRRCAGCGTWRPRERRRPAVPAASRSPSGQSRSNGIGSVHAPPERPRSAAGRVRSSGEARHHRLAG